MLLFLAAASDTQINQSLVWLVCFKLSVGMWPHWLSDHLQRKVNLSSGLGCKEIGRQEDGCWEGHEARKDHVSIPGWKSRHGFFCCSKDVTDDSTSRQVWVQINQQKAAFFWRGALLLLLFYFPVSHKAGLILRSPNLDAFFWIFFCWRYNVFLIFAVCEIAFIFPFWLGH